MNNSWRPLENISRQIKIGKPKAHEEQAKICATGWRRLELYQRHDENMYNNIEFGWIETSWLARQIKRHKVGASQTLTSVCLGTTKIN